MATLEGTGMDHTHIIGVKEISAVVKKLKQLQIKPNGIRTHDLRDLFHFYSLSTVHSYDLYHINFTSSSHITGIN